MLRLHPAPFTTAGRCRAPLAVRASAAGGQQAAAGGTYRVTIKKPLGLVLAEKQPTGEVFVEEVLEGGNAAKQGAVRAGDVLVQCSATVLKAGKDGQFEKEGYGQRPYDNWDRIMFDTRGQSFDTVMAAIGSNNERWGIMDVTLELLRPAQQAQQAQQEGEGPAS